MFEYGPLNDEADLFALANRIGRGTHRDKRDAKNEVKRKRFKVVEDCPAGGNARSKCMEKKVNLVQYDMEDFLTSCVDAYCELACVKVEQLTKASTPFTEAGLARPTASDEEAPGKLKSIASKVLMKILFAARMARFDLLRATQSLASRVTKWSHECDVSLNRLVCYIYHSKKMFLQGFVGDSFDECQVWLFADADADFAGENDAKTHHRMRHGNRRTEYVFPAT